LTSTIVLSVLPVVRFMLYVDPRSRRSAALSNENKKIKVSRQNTQTQKKVKCTKYRLNIIQKN